MDVTALTEEALRTLETVSDQSTIDQLFNQYFTDVIALSPTWTKLEWEQAVPQVAKVMYIAKNAGGTKDLIAYHPDFRQFSLSVFNAGLDHHELYNLIRPVHKLYN